MCFLFRVTFHCENLHSAFASLALHRKLHLHTALMHSILLSINILCLLVRLFSNLLYFRAILTIYCCLGVFNYLCILLSDELSKCDNMYTFQCCVTQSIEVFLSAALLCCYQSPVLYLISMLFVDILLSHYVSVTIVSYRVPFHCYCVVLAAISD